MDQSVCEKMCEKLCENMCEKMCENFFNDPCAGFYRQLTGATIYSSNISTPTIWPIGCIFLSFERSELDAPIVLGKHNSTSTVSA